MKVHCPNDEAWYIRKSAEVCCGLGWIEDIDQWRHPAVTVVDTDSDTGVLRDRCSHQESLLVPVNVQLELPVYLYSPATHNVKATSVCVTMAGNLATLRLIIIIQFISIAPESI